MHIVPLRFIFTVAIENLDSIVFPVSDVYPAVLIRDNIVNNVELSGIRARFAPREQQFSIRRIFMHARVAVSVGDINLSVWRKRHMRAAVEGLAALISRGLARNSDRHKDFSVEGALANRVIAVIGQKDRLIGTYSCAVRPLKNTVAPGAEKITVPIEDDYRMLSSCEAVDLILSVHGD